MVIGAHSNGHVGEGNRGDGQIRQEWNLEGHIVVDFAKRMGRVLVNTFLRTQNTENTQ